MFPGSSDLESSTFLHSVTCNNGHTCLACVYGCDTGMHVSSVVSEQRDITLFTHCLVCSCFTPLLIIYPGWNYISSFKLGEFGGVGGGGVCVCISSQPKTPALRLIERTLKTSHRVESVLSGVRSGAWWFCVLCTYTPELTIVGNH